MRPSARPLAVLFGSALVSCGGLSAQLRATGSATCTDLVAHQSQVLGDRAYRAQPVSDRETYEQSLARCDLSLGRPQAALDLSRDWTDSASRDEVVARGEAALGHGDATRRALEKLARESPPPPLFFDETTELWPYAAQDWYVVLALKAWKHGGGFSFDDYVSAMVRHAGETLVSLDVASAEAKEPTGTWALWTGATQEGRLDRDGHSTVLRAEGLDVHDEVTAEDRLVSMQTTQGPFTRYGYVSTPIYQTELVHREVLSRSGRAFFVRYPEATERLVAMHRFTAFGRYSGREDGVPVLEAVAVFDRDRK